MNKVLRRFLFMHSYTAEQFTIELRPRLFYSRLGATYDNSSLICDNSVTAILKFSRKRQFFAAQWRYANVALCDFEFCNFFDLKPAN